MVHYIKLRLPKYFRSNESKKLIYGNILCISCDNFDTMVIAVVKDRDRLHDGLLGVTVETDPFTIKYNLAYVVIESKAYFVSYMHTLKALKEFTVLPFEDYIVKGIETNATVEYLPDSIRINHLLDIHSLFFEANCDLKLHPPPDIHLDESQMRALQAALTRQVAIIQGPPGTGKTFLGLQITKILLHNRNEWNISHSPILVVCFTNHALDQFLEGITLFTNKIVRIGSRSKRESLRNYQLKNYLRMNKYHHNNLAYLAKRHQKLENLQNEIFKSTSLLEELKTKGILHKSFMLGKQSVIPSSLRNQLQKSSMVGFLTMAKTSTKSVFDRLGLQTKNQFRNQSADNEEVQKPYSYTDFGLNMEEQYHRTLDDCEETYPSLSQHVAPQIRPAYPELCFEITSEHIQNSENDDKEILLKIMEVICNYEVNVSECEALEFCNIRDLTISDRVALYCYWKKQIENRIQDEIKELELKYMRISKRLNDLKYQQHLDIMKEAEVVGMTTTGAAQYCKLLHKLAPPVVIIEEAAEILEAHVITSLSPNCKHLIMIGDHQQLRPKTNVFELAKHFHLDVSLFERLIKNGIHYEALEYQHRMKPEFSRLLVPLIYNNLKDHDSVHSYPKIRGVAKDLFFVDHTEPEKPPRPHCDSYENAHEAEFLMALCRHLLLQGYNTDDIAIITPYSGQFLCLRKLQNEAMFSVCQGVRISILDNYQGEESNIILLSLVRSNEEEKVGFIRMDSRICVALSRAKQGMYIMGNMTQLAKSCSMWENINEKLVEGGNIGPKLQLNCFYHPEAKLMVGSSEELFRKCPEGGCRQPCSVLLPNCGHKCQQMCHSYDRDHSGIKCKFPCKEILCELGHECPKLCYITCPPCKETVQKQFSCGHQHLVQCSVKENMFDCPTIVERELNLCKHKVKVPCYVNFTSMKCTEDCSTRLSCGHKCIRKCHPEDDPEHEDYMCLKSCENPAPNCPLKHKCSFPCYEKCGPCTRVVKQKFKCGHISRRVTCGYPLTLCSTACTKVLPCGHPCPRSCGEKCGGCTVEIKKTVPDCQHEVVVPCSIQPETKFCFGQCVKKLDCGHHCKNKCSEPCTDLLKCKEPVFVGHRCPRGHPIQFLCHKVHSDSLPSGTITAYEEKTIGECCTEICGAMLDCEHPCQGICGLCLNGRFHSQCKQRCGKVLVCGHVCDAPCSAVCPPCQKPCMWKCVHSACKSKCGIPCTPCKERCSRRCPHSACSAKCGEKCNRDPCSFPCPKRLRCGHHCIGFCGEPCPPLCKICDQEKVTEIFFGNEDEPEARFVILEDCQHVFESEGLDNLMKTTTIDGNAPIGMKKCPLCTKAIYNTVRYQAFILEAYNLVSKVKCRYFSKTSSSRESLLGQIKDFKESSWPNELAILRKRIGQGKKIVKISGMELSLFLFQINFLKAAQQVKNKLLTGKGRKLDLLVERVMSNSIRVSDQFMKEASSELRRLDVSFSVERIRKYWNNDNVRCILNKIDNLMKPELRFDENLEKRVISHVKEAEKFTGSLGITKQERLQVLSAMGFSKPGHWYACPNGHIYCIADCGGAMVQSRCPECKAAIGGSQHRLRSDNRVASEMDGATSSAWPNGS